MGLRSLVDLSWHEVEAGPFTFRIRNVTPADLSDLRAVRALLRQTAAEALVGTRDQDALAIEDEQERESAVSEARARQTLDGIKAMLDQPAMIRRHADHVARITSAAVRQVWVPEDGGRWEDLRLVLTEEEENPEQGRLWLASLGPHADTLGARVIEHCLGGGEALQQLETFRRRPRADSADRPDGEEVLRVAE